ncbi:MAG: CHAT domain-containing protein, partial [Anaerolineae bacterium]
MSVTLTLRTDAQHCLTVTCDGVPLADPTPLADLPALLALQAAPYDQGRALTAALGGADLLARLDADPDRLLLLDADAAAARIPWEYAALPETPQLLGCHYALLRLVDRPAPNGTVAAGTLQFLMLGADPLVDDKGRPREGYRLQLHTERRAIRRALEASGVDLLARQIAPTKEALHQALLRGPAILHLSAHGTVVETKDGPLALLLLEDEDGGEARLRGPDLVAMADPGVLRLVVLSACHTAQNTTEADLARALVQNGAPAAIGMQGAFPDDRSDELAATLYYALLTERLTIAQAVRHTRLSLSGDPAAAGLIVAYTARDGWGALPLRAGTPTVHSLRVPGALRLPSEIEAPAFFRGRNAELHRLAALYRRGTRVVTIVGTGGMGKTALAATFVERFGWRWPHGVLGVSFASAPLDARHFRDDLLRGLLGDAAQTLAEAKPADQERALMDALRDWDGLLLLDNYETVLQGLPEGGAEARAIHSLVARIARGGVALLLTSREHPAKLAGERVFPKAGRPLTGLAADPAAALFLHYSTRAKEQERAGHNLARQVAEATEGHPLAIALLAGEYDQSLDVASGDFLAHWGAELAQAEDYGLAEHHRTFIVAFERSYGRLPDEAQIRLRALSVLDFPFFAEAAAALWEPLIPARAQKRNIIPREGEDAMLSEAKHLLADFVRRSLLEADGWFDDDTPATYRFQPALQQILAHQLRPEERAGLRRGYAAYGAWLAKRGYLDIHKDPALSRVVRLSLDALDAATETLTGTDRLWHIRRVTWIKAAYGFTQEAFDLLDALIPPTRPLPDPAQDEELAKVESSLRYQLADLCVTRGDLDRALALYEESLQLLEHIGDLKGKAASLHQMAAVYLTRGDLDRALALYEESLQLKE